MAEIKAKVLEDEIKTPAQKEQEVQKDSQYDKESDMYKVDLSNPPKQEQDAVQEQKTEDGVLRGSSENEKAGQEAEVELQGVREEEVVLEEITDEKVEEKVDELQEEVEEAIEEAQETSQPLPENIQKVVDFMNETGGSLEDYVRLNADYSNVDDNTLLTEYYKQTKPHLSYDEINFLIEDEFDFDEEEDEPKFIKRKKLAHKEAIAQAKNHLEGLKSKYYEEVKLGSKLAPEQQKAVEFFNRYNNEQKKADELLEKQAKRFEQETNKLFNKDFKGFNFNVGEKKYRFNVKDASKVKEQNLSNVFDKYVDQNNLLTNGSDFHKALFAASNPDSIANHFYQQGKADAVKQITADAKNINMNPRKTSDGFVDAAGIKVRAISGDNISGAKLKLKNY